MFNQAQGFRFEKDSGLGFFKASGVRVPLLQGS